jgi:UDP-N-acetylmuramyl pentapeptide phosphotransferase/UDP-N-acetylglucosamine-1-phosphate transferase
MAVSLLIIFTQKIHGVYTFDSNVGLQKIHSRPTPRVGGVAIFVGLIVVCLDSSSGVFGLLSALCVGALPAFLVGLVEDITKDVTVNTRLTLCMVSGVLSWALLGVGIRGVGIDVVDLALSYTIFSALFTAFAVTGVIHGINMIDGYNGLASGIAMLIMASISAIALEVGDVTLFRATLALLFIGLGFFLINFPFGKIFLGDAGSYLLGFLTAWTTILLVERNESVNPWTGILLCAYPVVETVTSIFRRVLSGKNPGMADRGHLHSLVGSYVDSLNKKRGGIRVKLNSSITPIILILGSPAVVMAYFSWNDIARAQLSFCAFSILYYLLYAFFAVNNRKNMQ